MLQLTLPGGFEVQGPDEFKFKGSKVGDVLSTLLLYIFPIAGLILFFMLIAGGFGLLTSAGNPDKTKAAQAKLTSAIIGFAIIFVSYWLIQILQTILGFNILTEAS